MSLLWTRAVFGQDSEVYYHPAPYSLTPSQTTDLPIRFDFEPKGRPEDGAGTWKARLPSDHPGHEQHGWLAGYADVQGKDLPEDHPEDPGGYTTHIKMIETNPGYSGHGVGKALLEHVIRNSGYRGVTHGGLTESGARMWNSVTGEDQRASTELVGDRHRDWRWAV